MADKKFYNFTSPIGRLVSGAPDSYRTTNQAGEPLVYKSGRKKGEPKREYFVGIAFRKDQIDVPKFIRELNGYAAKEWPQLFDADLNCQFDGFASKITDGDSTKMNKRQRRPADNPDWKGCWILWLTADREPPCVSDGAANLIKPEEIKPGYYVRVKGSCCRNVGDTPGMYMNLEGLQLKGYGPVIENKPDPREAFLNEEATAVPEGMSTVPVSKGDLPVASRHPAPDPPAAPLPPGEQTGQPGPDKVLYQGTVYESAQLIKRGWTEAQVAALPRA